jgi:hypothetical protein
MLPVVVCGAGPVGLVLVLELAARQVLCCSSSATG